MQIVSQVLSSAGSVAPGVGDARSGKRKRGGKPQVPRRLARKRAHAIAGLCELLRRVKRLRISAGKAQQLLVLTGGMRRPRNALLVSFHPCRCALQPSAHCRQEINSKAARVATYAAAAALRRHSVSTLASCSTWAVDGGSCGKLTLVTTMGAGAGAEELEHFAPKLAKCEVTQLHFSVAASGAVTAACACAQQSSVAALSLATWRRLGEPVRDMSLLAQLAAQA